MLAVFGKINLPLSAQKTVGPATQLEYLGIILDSDEMMAKLPTDKLICIRNMVDHFLTIHKCTKRALLSLLGHLNFASRVVIPGRAYTSRLIQASKSVVKLHYYVYI